MNTQPILPAERRLSLYRSISRKLRNVEGGEGVRRAAIEMALEARRELHGSSPGRTTLTRS